MTEKTLLWTYFDDSVVVLVPKKRGTGFLRQPYGHHVDAGLEAVRRDLDDVDIFGLEGHLQIPLGIAEYSDPGHARAKQCLDRLSQHYGWPYEKVSTPEFFRLLKGGPADGS